MNKVYNPRLTCNAQALRRNMTKEERHLWYDFLKSYPVTFHRQKIIGQYIVDFYCPQAKIIIELDGSQHFDSVGKKSDSIRDAYLFEQGYQVLRYSNADIAMRFRSVCDDINNRITEIMNQSAVQPQKPSR